MFLQRISPVRTLSVCSVTLAFLCVVFSLTPSTALAIPTRIPNPLLRILDSELRSIIQGTREWGIIHRQRSAIRQIDSAALNAFDDEVLTELRNFQRMRDILKRGRTAREARDAIENFVEHVAPSRLRLIDDVLDDGARLREYLEGERFDFLIRQRLGLRGAQQADDAARIFLRTPEVDPIFIDAAEGAARTLTPAQTSRLSRLPDVLSSSVNTSRSATREVQTWFRRMDQCIRTAGARERENRVADFFRLDLGISLGMTAMGYISSAGERDIEWRNLPIELMFTVADKWTSSQVSFNRDPLRMRFVKQTFWNESRAALEAVVFTILPWSDRGQLDSIEQTARARVEWATMWNATTTWSSTLLSTLLGGWECLTPAPATRFMVAGLRLGNSLVRSSVYFAGRRYYFDEQMQEMH